MRPDHRPPSEDSPSKAVVAVEFRATGERDFAAVVSLHGEHDITTAPEVKQTIASIAGNVLVDLSACEFIDSSVIGVLIGGSRDLEREGRFLEIVVPPENESVARTLDVVRMRDLVVVHPVSPRIDSAGSDSE
jgi:anti-sigma B factor antagonist